MLGMSVLACSSLPVRSAVQVELIEDDVATVVDLDSGKEANVATSALPRGAREGDVVVDGRVDKALTAELMRQVHDLHARLAVPVPPGLDLSTDDDLQQVHPTPLTTDRE